MSQSARRSGLDLSQLFAGAVSAGTISPQTQSLLTGQLGNVVIAGAAGKDAEDIEATDVTLITVLLDASSSIASRRLEGAIRDGYNMLVHTFRQSRESDRILMALWTFNEHQSVVHSYIPVTDVSILDGTNYRASGATALYDTWCDALAANIAYAQQLRNSGTPCRSIVVVITDGEDVSSKRRISDCDRLSRDLLKSEQFVLAFVGVGNDVDFRGVARRMGIPDDCIEVQSAATAKSLHRIFELVSQSAIRVSQSRVGPGGNTGFFN